MITHHQHPSKGEIQQSSDTNTLKTTIVVGSGPCGVRFVQELYKRQANAKVLLFGDEAQQPYNRVQLSSLLANNLSRDAIDLILPSREVHANFQFISKRIEAIYPENNTVIDSHKQVYAYDKLVIATGAKAFVPNIPGAQRKGVYTFRNLKDTEHLIARLARSRHIVVIGGGLLGLEAAKALQRLNTKITVIQQGPRLMNRQLDDTTAAILQRKIEELGIGILTNDGVRAINYDNNAVLTAVTTHSGQEIHCDTVLLCAGIQANVDLARKANIKVGRGITVDDRLLTSVPNIYAIGECSEHRGQTYGLVNPGYEQAAVAAEVIANPKSPALYKGSLTVSRLKVFNQSVCSMGEVNELVDRPFQKALIYHNQETENYIKVVLHRSRIIGAVAFGEWPERNRVQEAFKHGRRVTLWQRWRFLNKGYFWPANDANNPLQWAADTVICQCNNVNQGDVVGALSCGKAINVPQLKACTQAATVCGSCQPLLEQIVQAYLPETATPEYTDSKGIFAWKTLAFISIACIALATTIALAPESQASNSVLTTHWFEKLWNNKLWKQISGFTLLGAAAIGLLMSMRKRLKWTWMGKFDYWRISHLTLGLLCITLLITHTGFHLGENLNRLLMVNFLALSLVGAIAGIVIALTHKLIPNIATWLRKNTVWLHIALSWPLPALIGAHILSVYYF